MQKVLLDAWVLLQPILMMLSTFFAAWLGMKLSKYLDANNSKTLQDQIRKGMADATAQIYQRYVKDLKDPTKPGVFDEQAQTRAAKDAVRIVTATHSDALVKLAGYGIDVNKFLDQSLEHAVIALEAQVTGTLAAPGTTARASSSPSAGSVVVIPTPQPSPPESTEVLTINAAASDDPGAASKDEAVSPEESKP